MKICGIAISLALTNWLSAVAGGFTPNMKPASHVHWCLSQPMYLLILYPNFKRTPCRPYIARQSLLFLFTYCFPYGFTIIFFSEELYNKFFNTETLRCNKSVYAYSERQ